MFYLDLPGREDGAEEIECPEVHALPSMEPADQCADQVFGRIARVRQTNAKASGGECIDVEVFRLRPLPAVIRYVFPRTHAVRFVERVPCEPVAVVSLKYETLEKWPLT